MHRKTFRLFNTFFLNALEKPPCICFAFCRVLLFFQQLCHTCASAFYIDTFIACSHNGGGSFARQQLDFFEIYFWQDSRTFDCSASHVFLASPSSMAVLGLQKIGLSTAAQPTPRDLFMTMTQGPKTKGESACNRPGRGGPAGTAPLTLNRHGPLPILYYGDF